MYTDGLQQFLGDLRDLGLYRKRQAGVSFGVSRLQSLPGEEVNRMEDKNRMKVTIWEAAEYLGLTPTTVQEMVERGVLKAEKFAGAIHIPREEVERIERETAP